ncbi:MAG TPA: Ig-like domain-containing protein, partial [Thermoanaerobaculia bacterium]
MKKLLAVASILFATSAFGAVRITEKPDRLVYGVLHVPIVADEPATHVALFINGGKYSEADGRTLTAQVNVGQYIRRLRMRAVAWDAAGNVVGEDEMVVNDPRPPFRVRLQAPAKLPESGNVTLTANVIRPSTVQLQGVDFYVGEEKIASDAAAPYEATFDAGKYPGAVYVRVVARGGSEEANDVFFFGDRAREQLDVTLQQIPLSIASGDTMLRAQDLTLVDNGQERRIESLVKADDQPLHVILLIDYSESMLEELPVVKEAARRFAQAVLRPQDRIAVVGFNQKAFWLTGYTNDF